MRNYPKHPLHRLALLKQNKGRWYTTHSQITSAIRRFTSSAARPGSKPAGPSFFPSRIRTIVAAQAGRAPFASTLRPNLTGGTLGRTAGGYGWGSGRAGGARHFSHVPTAPAQVMQNVSQAVRAFLVGGQKAQFDGLNPRTGEKRFKTVTASQASANRRLDKALRATAGSYLSFNLHPTVTALTPLTAVEGFAPSLRSEGVLDLLAVDFSRAVQELAEVLKDLQRLSALGDVPISYEQATLKVHFPGCDAQWVERICNELEVQQGVVCEDEEDDGVLGADMGFLFPFAPSQTPSAYEFYERRAGIKKHVQPMMEWQSMLSSSPANSEDSMSWHGGTDDELEDFVRQETPGLSSWASGYDSLHSGEADDMDWDERSMRHDG